MKPRRTLEQIIREIRSKGVITCPKLILKLAEETKAKEDSERVIRLYEKMQDNLKNKFIEHHQNQIKRYK